MTEPEFNPNITQKVVAATKKDLKIFGSSFLAAHKQGFIMIYSYGIAIALGIQTYWPEIAGYVPAQLRWVLGAATLFVVADKIRRSKPPTE